MTTDIANPVDLEMAEIAPAPKFALPPRMKRVSLRALPLINFDATNKSHRAAFAYFRVNGKWPNGMRFIEEYPYTSAVTTAESKLIEWTLRKELAALTTTNEVIKRAAT
jgi:hypothetical protein